MTTASSPRVLRREATRAAILAAARQIVLDDGAAALTMRTLADRLQYSPGTLYLYFADKEEIIAALVEDSFARLHAALAAFQPSSADPVTALEQMMRVYVQFGLAHPDHYALAFMVQPAARRNSALARGSKRRQSFQVLVEAVSECIRQRRFRCHDVQLVSQLLWTAVHGVTSLLIARPKFPWVERDALIAEVIRNAMRGLRPPAQGISRKSSPRGK